MKILTVTVPCYNSQDYMEKCIESLLTGGDRVEIIIIDDGSTDRTGAIADTYAEKYSDIVRVIHQENGGHGQGINQGLKHATGIYFKVVDSDDTVSADFSAFLDALEQCESQGGVDLAVTNYFYVHSDGIGDRAINYSNVLPENRIFGWKDTKPFRIPQMLTIHSCTFRTEVMRRSGQPLPKHVFYEDNLMIYQVLPNVQKLFYLNADLYRYLIGRPGQSVEQSIAVKRYRHQILITEKCFTAFHLDEIREPKLKKYLKHELFMMFGISISFTRLNKTAEADADLNAMWKTCIDFDQRWGKRFRYYSPLSLMCIPGRLGWKVTEWVYWVSKKVVRFN